MLISFLLDAAISFLFLCLFFSKAKIILLPFEKSYNMYHLLNHTNIQGTKREGWPEKGLKEGFKDKLKKNRRILMIDLLALRDELTNYMAAMTL